jgi:hypothetical protein
VRSKGCSQKGEKGGGMDRKQKGTGGGVTHFIFEFNSLLSQSKKQLLKKKQKMWFHKA